MFKTVSEYLESGGSSQKDPVHSVHSDYLPDRFVYSGSGVNKDVFKQADQQVQRFVRSS